MRELSLNGYIDDESWFGDEITPESLHDLLYGTEDTLPEDVHIRLNSYGGSCNAAVRMFDDIRAYPGNVMITISGTAASAATVVAMAADRLEMTPGSLFMIHDPSTVGKPQGIITAANGRLGFTHGGLRTVELGLLGGYGISGILCRSAQRVLLPGEGVDLFSRYPVFLLRGFHVGFRHNGCGVGFAQLILVPLIQCSRLTDGIAQRGLPLTGIVQSLGVIGLTVIAFVQFGGGLFQRTLVLCHHILLQLQPAFQRG